MDNNNNNFGQQPQSGQPYPQSGQPYPQSGQPYPQSGQPYPQSGQPYPQSGQPYPQSGQPYPQSGQPYPQSGQPYPQSGQPYPQSGQPYPQSGQPYPMSSQPYPMSGYVAPQPEKKEKNVGIVIIISVIVILVVAIIGVLVVMMMKKNANPMPLPPSPQPPMGAPMDMLDYSAYQVYETEVRKLVVDEQEISLPQKMLNINDLSYISVQDFANVFGYDTVFDMRNKQTTVSKGETSIVFSNGIATVMITENGTSREIPMDDKPMLFTNNQTYIPLKATKEIFNFKSIDWDEDTKTVKITTDGITVPVTTNVEKTDANVVTIDPNSMPTPPGGDGGMPPQGEMPQGGMPQDGAAPGGMPPGQN